MIRNPIIQIFISYLLYYVFDCLNVLLLVVDTLFSLPSFAFDLPAD